MPKDVNIRCKGILLNGRVLRGANIRYKVLLFMGCIFQGRRYIAILFSIKGLFFYLNK